MSCDAIANKDGVFEIEIRDYENASGRRLFETKRIRIKGLTPEHRIAIEIIEGEAC